MGIESDRAAVRPLVRPATMLGKPVEENPIDLLFNHFYERFGVPIRLLKTRVESSEELGACLRGARALGFVSAGITVPYKEAVIPHLDEIEERSRGIGAVNLVEFVGEDRAMVGRNTDGPTLARTIERRTGIAGARICMLGAGGAARGIGAELARRGARSIAVGAIEGEQGAAVVEMLRRFGSEGSEFGASMIEWEGELSVPEGTDIVINATGAGAAPALAELELDWPSVASARLAVDVVTGPRSTGFLRRAHELGLSTIDGADMLVDIVHESLAADQIEVPREEIAAYAGELAGEALGH